MADASESSRPFSTTRIETEEQWARHHRAMGHQEGVVNTTLLHDPPDLKVIASGATSVIINAGEAGVNGFMYANSQPITRTVPTNASGSTARNDTVVLEINQSTNEGTIKYLTGGASAPTLTRNIGGVWQMPLAHITVRARTSTVAAADVEDRRQFVMHQGIVMNTGAQSPTGKLGQFQYRPAGLYIFNAAGTWQKIWPLLDPVWTYVAFGSGVRSYNEGAGSGYYHPAWAKFADGVVRFRGLLEPTNNTIANGGLAFTLPDGARPGAGVKLNCWAYNYNSETSETRTVAQAQGITIHTDGKVTMDQGLIHGGWLSIDGLSFWSGQ